MENFDSELDACGLNCPLPIVRAKKAMSGLNAGHILKILSTDPGSARNFEAYCSQTGNELLSSTENNGQHSIFIKIITM